MKAVAVSEIKASLSRYLATVKGGEEITIMDRGKPVAKLVPLTRDENAVDARIIELERAGLVRVGTGIIKPEFWKHSRPPDKKGAALSALIRERVNGR